MARVAVVHTLDGVSIVFVFASVAVEDGCKMEEIECAACEHTGVPVATLGHTVDDDGRVIALSAALFNMRLELLTALLWSILLATPKCTFDEGS